MSTTVRTWGEFDGRQVKIAARRCDGCLHDGRAQAVRGCVYFFSHGQDISLCTARCWPELVGGVDAALDAS